MPLEGAKCACFDSNLKMLGYYNESNVIQWNVIIIGVFFKILAIKNKN